MPDLLLQCQFPQLLCSVVVKILVKFLKSTILNNTIWNYFYAFHSYHTQKRKYLYGIEK